MVGRGEDIKNLSSRGMEGSNGAQVSNDEVLKLAEYLKTKFENGLGVVVVLNVMPSLKETFKKIFGTYVDRETFESWLRENNLLQYVPGSTSGDPPNGKGYVSSASSGTTVSTPSTGAEKPLDNEKSTISSHPSTTRHFENKGSSSRHFESGRSGREWQQSGKSGSVFLEWEIYDHKIEDIDIDSMNEAVRRVVLHDLKDKVKHADKEADRRELKLALISLLGLNKPITQEQLVEAILELKDMIEKRYNTKLTTIKGLSRYTRKALSKLSGVTVIDDEHRGVTWYELSTVLKEKIWEAYASITSEKLPTSLSKGGMDKEDMVNRFAYFLTNYHDNSGKAVYIEQLKDLLSTVPRKGVVISWEHVNSMDPELANMIIESPEDAIEAAEDAIQLVLDYELQRKDAPRFHARFTNLPVTLSVREVGAKHVNKLVQIEGIVSRQGDVKPFIQRAVFVCKDCGNEMVRLQRPYKPMVKPLKCDACGSRDIEEDFEKSVLVNSQYFRIQELPETLQGTNARTIEAVVLDDLVDSFLPGDRVRVVGIFRIVAEHGKNKLPIYRKILEVNNIEVLSRGIMDIELTEQDKDIIRKLGKRKDIVDVIVRSIAPSLKGRDVIKKGIALTLFSGGRDWPAPDGTTTRSRSHILLIGDPGTAKSQLARFLKQVIPRGIFTVAKTSSAAGLTAAVVKDEFTGEWGLEAGALVLANGGICVIDEIDKMNDKDRTVIHEALEQGTISIAKAGNTVTLSAKTIVIGIGNPKEGRFNRHKGLPEQVDLPPTLLSRFDLIFYILDEPDPQLDEEIARHIIEYKLMGKREKVGEVIPPELLRKYIAYAHQYVEPKITKEAEEEAVRFYVKMRQMAAKSSAAGVKAVPITARQLEGILRLARARARMRLADEITKEDVLDVIDVLMESLKMVAVDEDGNLDVTILEVGKSAKRIAMESRALEIIRALEADTEFGAPKDDVIQSLREEFNISRIEAEEILSGLLRGGDIYMPRSGYYRLSSTR